MKEVKRRMAEAAAAAGPQMAAAATAAATAAAQAASRAMFGPAGAMPHPTGLPTSSSVPGADVMSADRLRMEQERRRAAAEQSRQQAQAKANEEADDFVATTAGHDEHTGDQEIYASYQPVHVLEGVAHPDHVVETSSLANVQPPEIRFNHNLKDCVKRGQLSSLQLETVLYANMRFNLRLPNGSRAGFFLGDGAGVGKGRQIAACVKQAHRQGVKRFLWITVSNDLKFDSERDLKDVGCNLTVYPQGRTMPGAKVKLGKDWDEGVLVITYSLLVSGTRKSVTTLDDQLTEHANVTADNLAGLGIPQDSRLAQLVRWLSGTNGRGDTSMIILDECHKAKNLLPSFSTQGRTDNEARAAIIDMKNEKGTMTGKAVGALQELLPDARLIYSSATGATEPRNLAYAYRVGSCGFGTMAELIMALTKSGLGALELFAMGLKATGTMVSRALSYSGAEFSLAQVPTDPVFAQMYDRSTEFWNLLFNIQRQISGKKRTFASQFWGTQMRFYKQMLMALKVPECARLALKAVEDGMAVVIGLQSTGEANMNTKLAEAGSELDDYVSAPQMILYNFIQNHWPDCSDMSDASLNSLQSQVYHTVQTWSALPTCAEMAQRHGKRAGRASAKASAPGPSRSAARPRSSAAAASARVKAEPVQPKPGTVKAKPGTRRGIAPAAAESGDVMDLTQTSDDEADEVPAPAARRRSAPARAVTARRSTFARAGAAAPERAAAAAAPAAVEEDEEDEVMFTEEKSLDDVLAEKLLHAERTGQLIDMTKDVDEHQVRSINVQLERQDADERLAAVKRGLDAELVPLREQKAVLEAELAVIQADLVAAESSAAESSKPQGGRLLKRGSKQPAEAGKPAAGSDEEDSEATVAAANVLQQGAEGEGSDSDVTEPASLPPEGRAAGLAQVLADSDDEMEESGAQSRAKQAVIAESDEEMESPKAGRRAHPSPVATKSESAAVSPGGGAVCRHCHKSDTADEMLVCDGCDWGHHLGCLDMSEVPDGIWFCATCKAAGVTTMTEKAAEFHSQYAGDAVVSAAKVKQEAELPVQQGDSVLSSDDFEAPAASGKGGVPSVQLLALRRRLMQQQEELAKVDSELTRMQGQHQRQLAKSRSASPVAGRTAKRIKREPKYKAEAVSEPEQSDGDSDYGMSAEDSGRKLGRHNSTEASESSSIDDDSSTDTTPNPSGPAARGCNWGASGRGARNGQGSAAQGRGPRGNSRAVLTEDFDDEEMEELRNEIEDDEHAGGRPDDRVGPKPQLQRIKKMLLRLLKTLELPPNPLDEMIDKMGGIDHVAELTGRQGGLCRDGDKFKYRARNQEEAQKMVNMKEKQSFMDGHKLIAIISEAASVGISLQADKRVPNQRRRVHLTLELPWSADRAIQQFGRSHRSNQASAPIYRILVSECSGEYRFASSAAKRLQSLGALLKGDRRALGAGTDLQAFDVDNQWGKKALKKMYQDIMGITDPAPDVVVPKLPSELEARLQDDGSLPLWRAPKPSDKLFQCFRQMLAGVGATEFQKRFGSNEVQYQMPKEQNVVVPKFLNRLLALKLLEQKVLFDFFSSTLESEITLAKSMGNYETGIVRLNARSAQLKRRDVLHVDPQTGAKTFASKVELDHGMSWEEALAARDELVAEAKATGKKLHPRTGFYRSQNTWEPQQGKDRRPLVFLASEVPRRSERDLAKFRRRRPNNLSGDVLSLDALMQSNDAIGLKEAEKHWRFWQEHLKRNCMHGHKCIRRARGDPCYQGASLTTLYLIHGAVLPIWKVLAHGAMRETKGEGAPKVVRFELTTGEKMVGLSLSPEIAARVLGDVEAEFGVPEEQLERDQAEQEGRDPIMLHFKQRKDKERKEQQQVALRAQQLQQQAAAAHTEAAAARALAAGAGARQGQENIPVPNSQHPTCAMRGHGKRGRGAHQYHRAHA